MRLVVARLSARYEGRLSSTLPAAVRLVMVKADGCVAIHADTGAYKPLNWMNAPNVIEEAEGRWVVTNPKGERLTIDLHEVLDERTVDLDVDHGVVLDGPERELQRLLAANPGRIEAGLTLVAREFATDLGPVDLLCRDAEGGAVAVEVKRVGEISGVEQLCRYLERMARDPLLRPVRGVLVAAQVKPQARVLARARGISWVEVDLEELRGDDDAVPRLF